jgi:putative ABC transport system permease protein
MTVPRWRRYLRLTRPDVEADIDDELQFHLDMRVERNRTLGMSDDDAKRDATSRFGDVALVRDELTDHDRRQLAADGRKEYMGDVLQDLRFGLRSLRRAPGFAMAAVLTLAVGIGANASIFSVVNAVLLEPLPFTESDRLVYVGEGAAGEFANLSERLRGFEGMALSHSQTHPVDDGNESVRLEGAAVSTNLFTLLGVAPLLGRTFTAEDATPGNGVIVLSHGLWQRQFGGSREAIGRRVLVEGMPHTIVGVMPPSFAFPDRSAQYWHPYVVNPANMGQFWAVGGKQFIARLAPGTTLAQGEREVREVWPSLRPLNPLWDPGEDYRRDVRVVPLQEAMVGGSSNLLWVLFGAVMVVLLIGCVNVANLLLARASAREREFAVRAALGGGRARLVRQLLTESLLLAGSGALAGVALAFASVRWLVSVMPAEVPRAEAISVDGTVLAFTAVVAVITGLLFGLVPALRATSRSASAVGIGSGRRGTAGAGHHRVTGWLVGAEVALAVTLVIGSLLLLRSFAQLRQVETGFRPEQLIAARVTPPWGEYQDAARVTALYTRVMEEAHALPGVTSVAAVDKLPIAQTVWGVAVRVEGQFEDGSRLLPELAHLQSVTPDYFATMGVRLLRGRTFTAADREGQAPVAIISESTARKFWPNDDAVGKRLGYAWPGPWLTVVGVVADTKQDGLRDTSHTSMFTPWEQRTRMSGSEMWVVVRGSGDPGPLADGIRRIVREAGRSVAVSDVRTMSAVIAGSMQRARFTMSLVAGFAAIALLLGAIGIYGVMSYLVGLRQQEMGIRLALGAGRSRVLALVVGRGAMLAAGGAAVGLVIAWFGSGAMAALLYGVSPRDPVTFAVVPLVFLAIALSASLLPALRATRVDPARALRAD